MKFGLKIKKSLMNYTKPFPSDRDLRKSLIEMKKWTEYKQKLQKSCLSDKYNKLYSIDQQWRLPWNIPVKTTTKIDNPFDPDNSNLRVRYPKMPAVDETGVQAIGSAALNTDESFRYTTNRGSKSVINQTSRIMHLG